MLDNPSQIPSFLAESLPSQSVFFICYIMLATLTGYALQLLRIVPLILVAIKRKWLAKTPREHALAWKPPAVLYDRVVSILIRQSMGDTCSRNIDPRKLCLGMRLEEVVSRLATELTWM